VGKKYTPEFRAECVEEALEKMAEGELLEDIADDIFGIPRQTLGDWLRQDAPERYEKVKPDQARALFLKGHRRAINATKDTAQADRLAAESYQKLAARLDPRNWSEKHQIEHTGTVTYAVASIPVVSASIGDWSADAAKVLGSGSETDALS